MLKFLISFSYFIYSVSGNGEFTILQSPKSLEFSGNEVIDGNDIAEVFGASMGFTIGKGSDWPGLTIKNPFGFADVVAVVAVEGVSSLGDFQKLPIYPIDPVRDEFKIWKAVQEDILEHYPTIRSNKILRVELGSGGNETAEVSVKALNKQNDEDAFFLQDISELKSYIDNFERKGITIGETPEVYWFVLSSLHTLADVHGPRHPATLEAKELVREASLKLGRILSIASNGRALVAAIVSDGAHTRQERAAGDSVNGTAPGNRATVYSESYPAIFNIILWFTVAFIFSLIAISYFIGTMDPGRDSIIYRMTSNRMKKDS